MQLERLQLLLAAEYVISKGLGPIDARYKTAVVVLIYSGMQYSYCLICNWYHGVTVSMRMFNEKACLKGLNLQLPMNHDAYSFSILYKYEFSGLFHVT